MGYGFANGNRQQPTTQTVRVLSIVPRRQRNERIDCRLCADGAGASGAEADRGGVRRSFSPSALENATFGRCGKRHGSLFRRWIRRRGRLLVDGLDQRRYHYHFLFVSIFNRLPL